MAIDTNKPLYDNDGYQHHFVIRSYREIVTRISGILVIWDARTGVCLKQGGEGCILGNEPLPPEELARRKEEGLRMLNELRVKAPQQPNGQLLEGN